MSIYKTKKDLLKRAQEAIGVPFKVMDTVGRLSSGKGGIGNMVEECWFGQKPNNRPEPDFPEAGVELKVTPFKRIRHNYSAKERLVLNIIDYMEEYNKTFETSGFWKKNKSLLLLFYENIQGMTKGDFSVQKAILYEYPEKDLEIIRADWEKIVGYIRAGKAHELSEGMTNYLGACTKGETADSSMREQPNSTQKAKQRAYSFKTGYMTTLVRKFVVGSEEDEAIIKDASVLREMTLEAYIQSKIEPYIGQSQASLMEEFKVGWSKSVNAVIVSRILRLTTDISESEEFKKADIKVKTIRVTEKGKIIENMSFPAFKFKELVNETWEESEFRELLETSRFMFAAFQCVGCEHKPYTNCFEKLIFKGIKFWSMPMADIETDVRSMWEHTADVLREGVELTPRGSIIGNNLPKQSENRVSHVRPHTRKASYEPYNPYADELPDGRWMTKQCFWLNNSYVVEQIKDLLE